MTERDVARGACMLDAPATISDVRNHAADLIDDGWCQGPRVPSWRARDTDRFCATTALQRAGRDLDADCLIVDGWIASLGMSERALVAWNDEPGRIREEVVELLRGGCEQ